MHSFTLGLIAIYKKNANKEIAAGAKAYMRNQFEFFGLKARVWRNLFKEYSKKNRPPYAEIKTIVKELWSLPERELQFAAVELLGLYKKEWDRSVIKLVEYIITHKSWWDTVDHAASELTGPYFLLFPGQVKKITAGWNRSENIWLQRSSLMFQKKYKGNTDPELLSRYILSLRDSKEFFIQKAIGWALREYSKNNPVWVRNFVKQHKLAPLSEREALKRIK